MGSNKHPPIIDSHIHLFESSHLPHLAWAVPESPLYATHSVDEYLAAIPAAQHASFRGFVFIETDRRHTVPSQQAIQSNDTTALSASWKWPLEEFDFAYRLSQQSDLVRGIVPWAPMNLGVPAMQRYWSLLELTDRRRHMLKGFRYLVQDKPRGTITAPEFVAAMDWVWRKGLVVEIGVDVRTGGIEQLEEAVSAITRIVCSDDVPAVTGAFVINHLGKPDLQHTRVGARWSELLTSLAAAHPCITMKLSGVFSELPHDPSVYTDSAESVMLAHVAPWAEAALTIFGPNRVLWGSDWPVCMLGYGKMFPALDPRGAWECWRSLVEKLCRRVCMEQGGADESAVWAGNAVRIYKLEVDGL